MHLRVKNSSPPSAEQYQRSIDFPNKRRYVGGRFSDIHYLFIFPGVSVDRIHIQSDITGDTGIPTKKTHHAPWVTEHFEDTLMCRPWVLGLLGPKFSKQGSLFGRFSLDMGGFSRTWQRNCEKWMVVFFQNSS